MLGANDIQTLVLVVGFAIVIVVHELGHYLQSKAMGCKPTFSFDGWSLNVNFKSEDYFRLTPPMILLISLQGILFGGLVLGLVIYITGFLWLFWVYLLMCSQDMQTIVNMLKLWRKWGTPIGYEYLKQIDEHKQNLMQGLDKHQSKVY